MAYSQLLPGQLARNVRTVYWVEELEKAGYTYWDFCEYCDSQNFPIAVSCVHDQDVYNAQDVRDWIKRHSDKKHYSYITSDLAELEKIAPKVGDRKKSHIHFGCQLPGRHTGAWFSEQFADFLPIQPTRWQRILSWDGTVRYFAHLDSPDKYQYPSASVQSFGGADISALISKDGEKRTRTLMFIKKEIYEHNFQYFHELDRWAYQTGDMDTINMVAGRSSYFASIFSSKRQQKQDKRQAKMDKKLAEKEASGTA